MPMSPKVFSEVRAGNREFVKETKSDVKQLAFLVTDRGNSILHVAAASGHPWLSNIILDVNSLFFLALLLLLIPYVTPQTPSQPILRHIFYYPYFLLLLAVGDQTNYD